MSKADKAANRSAIKNRAWGESGFSLKPKAICRESWWADACGVSQRDEFIAAAKKRAEDFAWGSQVPSAMTRSFQ